MPPGGAGRRARPGRPRDSAADERILRATLQVLGSNGLTAMTMDAVAAKAGVSKPTIYRRWPTKIELATAAIAIMVIDDPVNEETDVWKALHHELVLFEAAMSRGRGMAIIGNLLAHEEQQPELIAHYREGVARQRRGRLRQVLHRGAETGQLRPDTDVVLITNMLLGYYFSTHMGGDERPTDWPSACIAVVRAFAAP